MNFVRPNQALGLGIGLGPDAVLFRIDFARPIQPDTSTRTIAYVFRAVHWADQSGGVKHTLTTHLAAKNWLLGNNFYWTQHQVQKMFQAWSFPDKFP